MHQASDTFPHTSSTKHIASKKPCWHQNAADTCRIRKGSRVSKATNLFRLKRMLKKLPESLHCFRSRNVSWPSFCIMIPWSHNSVQGSYATPNRTLSSCSPETSAGKEITTQRGKPAVRIIFQLFILPPCEWQKCLIYWHSSPLTTHIKEVWVMVSIAANQHDVWEIYLWVQNTHIWTNHVSHLADNVLK